MRKLWNRIFAWLLVALTLWAIPAAADSPAPAVRTFSLSRTGTSTWQARSYRIIETARGRFAWIELYDCNTIVLPVTDEEMADFSALIAELNLSDWNGFCETDPDALDGESFSLAATFAEGSMLSAYGANRFPEDYGNRAARVEEFFWLLMASWEIHLESEFLK